MSENLLDKLCELLLAKKMKLVTAESCTGGLLAATLTHKEGISEVFERGFITYANEAKTELLGVPAGLIADEGAVNPQVTQAMATGALENSKSDIAISITGIAGPGGGTDEKPVGLVYIGYALKGGSAASIEHRFEGSREDIQKQTTLNALKYAILVLEKET